MLISSSTVSETYLHVIKDLVNQMSRKILQRLGLLEYMQNHIYIDNDFNGPSKSWKDQQKRIAILDEDCFRVSFKFNNNSTGLKWDINSVGQHLDPAIHRRDTMSTDPLFFDPETGINIIERYLPCNIELECQLAFTDRVLAFDAVTNMVNTFNRGELLTLTNFSYDYQFPIQLLSDLYTLGTMKNIPKGKYMEWISKCSKNRIQLIASKRTNNRHHEMVVKKEIYEVLGSFDYNPDQPAIETPGTSANIINISFNSVIQFSRTNMLYLKYPIVVNNMLVPESLIHVPKSESYERLIRLLKYPYNALNPEYQNSKKLMTLPVRAPWYDNWHIPSMTLHDDLGSKPFFIGIVTLDMAPCSTCLNKMCRDCTKGKYTILDLYKDMDQFELTDEVKLYYLTHKELCLDPSQTMYNVAIYANDRMLSSKLIEFDGRYIKITNPDPPVYKIYRLVLTKTKFRITSSNIVNKTGYINNKYKAILADIKEQENAGTTITYTEEEQAEIEAARQAVKEGKDIFINVNDQSDVDNNPKAFTLNWFRVLDCITYVNRQNYNKG